MFNVVIAVNPSEHAVVACLWAFKYIVKPGRNKASIIMVTGYSREKYFLPMASSYSSKIGQNTTSTVFKEHLEKQLQENYSSYKAGSDYDIIMESGCPVDGIKNKVLETDALVLIMGEKHQFSKRNTVWSNTIYKCIMVCPCISLIVRPTCFDIFQTDPLIEIFRHPAFHGDYPIFDFVLQNGQIFSQEQVKKQEESTKPSEKIPPQEVPKPPEAEVPQEPAKSKEKKDLFGKLLQKKGQESSEAKTERERKELLDMDKMKMVGTAKKGKGEPNNEKKMSESAKQNEDTPDKRDEKNLQPEQLSKDGNNQSVKNNQEPLSVQKDMVEDNKPTTRNEIPMDDRKNSQEKKEEFQQSYVEKSNLYEQQTEVNETTRKEQNVDKNEFQKPTEKVQNKQITIEQEKKREQLVQDEQRRGEYQPAQKESVQEEKIREQSVEEEKRKEPLVQEEKRNESVQVEQRKDEMIQKEQRKNDSLQEEQVRDESLQEQGKDEIVKEDQKREEAAQEERIIRDELIHEEHIIRDESVQEGQQISQESKEESTKNNQEQSKETEQEDQIIKEKVLEEDRKETVTQSEESQSADQPKEKKGFFKNLLGKDKQAKTEQQVETKDRDKYEIKDTDMTHFAGPSKRTNQ